MPNRFAVIIVALIFVPLAKGQAWLNIADVEFNHRQALTIESTADVDSDSVLVHLPITLPANRVAVAPVELPTGIARDKIDQFFIPFQVDGNVLTFALPLKAKEKKQIWLYSSDKPVNMPGFAPKVAYDNRQAYRSFENNLAAFRVESGSGANTTGMVIDTFGKTEKGQGLRLVELYQTGHDSYHVMSYWGIDTLQVGSSPGLGGVYIYVGDQSGRAAAPNIWVDTPTNGPIELKVHMTAPVSVANRNFTLDRTLTLWADERGIRDDVRVTGDNLDGVQLGVGLRNLPNEQWTEKFSDGYAFVAGDANQQHYKAVSLGAVFNPAQYVKTIPLTGNNGGHVYILNMNREGNALVSRHHFGNIWDGDGQISTNDKFEEYLKRQAKLLQAAPKVTLSDKIETK
jgi:hypothetical protein